METRRFGSLTAGIDILELLASRPEGMGVTELARQLDMDKGHVHRLLRALEERDYVEQSPSTKHFRTTAQFVALAGRILRNLDVLPAASPIMLRLLASTGEAVHLARRVRSGAVYVAQERPPTRISVETEIGSQPELHCTATGKAIIAHASDEELQLLLTEPFVRHTHRTLTSFGELERELSTVRARGYAVDDEELSPEVRCVAAPIFDMMAKVVGCVGLSGPISRVSLDRIPELGTAVAAAAYEIGLKIGGHLPGNASPAGEVPGSLALTEPGKRDASVVGSASDDVQQALVGGA